MFKIFKSQSGLAPITIALLVIGAFLLGSVISLFLYPYLHPPEPCDYDTFKGKCKITSINKRIKFRFTPTEPLNLENVEWVKVEWTKEEDVISSINREYDELPNFLGLECLENIYSSKYHLLTKEDLEKCNVRENAVFDCEAEIIIKGKCRPVIFHFIDTSD